LFGDERASSARYPASPIYERGSTNRNMNSWDIAEQRGTMIEPLANSNILL
jgi:hypothetical protein